jgi:2-polyprenyl-6-methoxyphenol hydroxylase-like FAD-dependent oxidoreductase
MGDTLALVHVLIAGAGIAGLTTALSLHAAGIEARLVDSATELRLLGVGVNLLPHAVRDRLGKDAVRTGATVTGFTERDGSVGVQLSIRANGPVVPAIPPGRRRPERAPADPEPL